MAGVVVPSVDHTGRQFPSVGEMCAAWGRTRWQVRYRLAKGWGLERALTEPARPAHRPTACMDHQGRRYPSIGAMCRKWGLSSGAYQGRRARGWSVERALTEPLMGNAMPARDHLGRDFPSMSAMCMEWGRSLTLVLDRLGRGWSVRDALTRPPHRPRQGFMDHTGQRFGTLREMCAAWGITCDAWRHRRAAGWTKKKALETPVRHLTRHSWRTTTAGPTKA